MQVVKCGSWGCCRFDDLLDGLKLVGSGYIASDKRFGCGNGIVHVGRGLETCGAMKRFEFSRRMSASVAFRRRQLRYTNLFCPFLAV